MIFNKYVPVSIKQQYRYDSLSGIFFAVYMVMIFPFINVTAVRMGATPFIISFIVSAPFVGQLFSLLWVGWMKDKKKQPIVVYTGIISRSMFFLMFFITNPVYFSIFILIQSVIASGAFPAYAEVMKRIYPDEYRGRAMGFVRIEVQFIALTLAVLAGKLMDIYGYSIILPLGGLFGAISSFTFSKIKVNEVLSNDNVNKSNIYFDKYYIMFLCSIAFWDVGNLLSSPVYPIFMVNKLNITNYQIGILNLFQSIFSLIGFNYWGNYVDKKNLIKGITTCMFCFFAYPVVYLYVNVLHLSFWYLLPSVIFTGFGVAGMELLVFNTIFRFAPQDLLPKYIAMRFLFGAVVGIIVPHIGTRLYETIGMNSVLITSVFFIITSIILINKYYSKSEKFIPATN